MTLLFDKIEKDDGVRSTRLYLGRKQSEILDETGATAAAAAALLHVGFVWPVVSLLPSECSLVRVLNKCCRSRVEVLSDVSRPGLL